MVRDFVDFTQFLPAYADTIVKQYLRFDKGKRVALYLGRVVGVGYIKVAVVVVEYIGRQGAGYPCHVSP